MNWPQYTYLALIFLGLGIAIAKHGEPSKPHNFFTSLIATGLSLWLLYMGGFFGGGA
jgi:hypothetical protein